MLFKKENTINDRRRYDYFPRAFMMVVFAVYAILSLYEIYINKSIGAITKYYIFLLIVILLFQYKFVKIQYYHFCILAWLALKFLSIFWSWNGYNKIVQTQILSQLGMVALFCVLTIVNIDEASVRKILTMFKICSFSLAILATFFSNSYVSRDGQVFENRRVLTLFGAQDDPNNLAASCLVGIALALYFALHEHKNIIFNLIIFVVNTFALLQTSSRGGFLSLLAICTLYALLPIKGEKARDIIIRAAILIVGILFIYFFVLKYVFPDALERLFSSQGYAGGSGRTSIWENALELFCSNPLIGGGWGSYYGYNNIFFSAHNTFIQSLCDTGIIGSVLLFVPIIRVFVVCIKQKYFFPLLFLCSALMPAFFIDSMNKRFFWNAIILSNVMLNSNMSIQFANQKKNKKNKKETNSTVDCKYIKQI